MGTFITSDWLRAQLSKSFENDSLKIIDFEIGDGLEKGENYASATGRISVLVERSRKQEDGTGDAPATTRRDEIKLFAKFIPPTGAQRDFVVEYRLFEREAEFYNHLLPALQNLQKRVAGDGEHHRLSLDFATAHFAGADAIIMEDLAAKGFRMADRKAGLTESEAVVALKAFARFHAHGLYYTQTRSKAALEEELPLLFAVDLVHDSTVCQLYADQSTGRKMVAAVAKAHRLDRPELVRRLETYVAGEGSESLRERIKSVLLHQPEGSRHKMATFTMMDCWVNNLMFRYEKDPSGVDVPVAASLIDLQFARFGHPLCDVAMLWYSSASVDVFRNSLEKLLRVYYDEFFSCLEALGTRPGSERADLGLITRETYSFEDMFNDYRKCEEAGLLMSLSWQAVIMTPKEDVPTEFGENFVDDFPAFVECVCAGPMGAEVVRRITPLAERAMELGIV